MIATVCVVLGLSQVLIETVPDCVEDAEEILRDLNALITCNSETLTILRCDGNAGRVARMLSSSACIDEFDVTLNCTVGEWIDCKRLS